MEEHVDDFTYKTDSSGQRYSYLCKYIVPSGYPEHRVTDVIIDTSVLDDKYELLLGSLERVEGDKYRTLGSRSMLVIGKTTDNLNKMEKDMNEWLLKLDNSKLHYRTDLVNCGLEIVGDVAACSSSEYLRSGVNIDLVSETLKHCSVMIERTHTPEVVKNRGGFGGLFSLNSILSFDLTEPILVTSTDGVGTKTEFVYRYLGASGFAGIGKDLVNHCINDILVQGASPLYFVDYFASSRFSASLFSYFIMGVTEACEEAECALIGGETAEMPGIYNSGSHDVVGTITGIVDGEYLIDGKRNVCEGDVIIGLPSNGLHTNGFSLIRKMYKDVELDEEYVNQLVGYHRSYLKDIRKLFHKGIRIHGLCHITGGGLIDNPPRVMPDDLCIDYDSKWEIPEMYRRIQRDSGISDEELKRVFNCGVGMMIFVTPGNKDWIMKTLPDSFLLGTVIKNI